MTYHSEVVGSLLRPIYLVDARKQFEAGQLSAADFKAVEDQAVNEAIALQETAGIDVITDGEMRRYAFYGHLIDALEGFDKFGRSEERRVGKECRSRWSAGERSKTRREY